MARWYKPVLALSVIALFLFAAFGAAAQQFFSNPNPVGQVRIVFKTGSEWALGYSSLMGKNTPLQLRVSRWERGEFRGARQGRCL